MSYQAEILWPHEEGSIEQLGYEFANAKTKEYQTVCWRMLLERAAQQSVHLTALRRIMAVSILTNIVLLIVFAAIIGGR